MKNAIPAKAARLLRRVAKRILEEPKRLDMKRWGYKKEKAKGGPACGTVGCIAGWTVLDGKTAAEVRGIPKETYDRMMEGAERTAAEMLGLSREVVTPLFYPKHPWGEQSWPASFRIAYNKSKTPRQRAKVTVERIEHFIKTGE